MFIADFADNFNLDPLKRTKGLKIFRGKKPKTKSNKLERQVSRINNNTYRQYVIKPETTNRIYVKLPEKPKPTPLPELKPKSIGKKTKLMTLLKSPKIQLGAVAAASLVGLYALNKNKED